MVSQDLEIEVSSMSEDVTRDGVTVELANYRMAGSNEGWTLSGHLRIAYNSCRNRHCPRCQGAAARDWLAEREADLLPVGYFHVVFTLETGEFIRRFLLHVLPRGFHRIRHYGFLTGPNRKAGLDRIQVVCPLKSGPP